MSSRQLKPKNRVVKPKMVRYSKISEIRYASPVEVKLKKKIKPKTRKFKDGKEVTHQDGQRARAEAITEYMSERAGGATRKILRKKK